MRSPEDVAKDAIEAPSLEFVSESEVNCARDGMIEALEWALERSFLYDIENRLRNLKEDRDA